MIFVISHQHNNLLVFSMYLVKLIIHQLLQCFHHILEALPSFWQQALRDQKVSHPLMYYFDEMV